MTVAAAVLLCASAAVAAAERRDVLALAGFEAGETQVVASDDRDGRRISRGYRVRPDCHSSGSL